MSIKYLVAFGSNLEPRLETIKQTLDLVRGICPIEKVSSLYHTSPVGPADQEFINGAMILCSKLEPEAMLSRLLDCELAMGRVRTHKWGNRAVDLDILLIQNDLGSLSWTSPTLTAPHPEMIHRDFVLCPACEIAPQWLLYGSDVRTYSQRCTMKTIIRKEKNSKLFL